MNNDVLVIVAYHNGSVYLDELLLHLTGPVLVVDTGSTREEVAALQHYPVEQIAIAGGFCTAAYEAGYRQHPKYAGYLFLHDSLRVKVMNVQAAFRGRGPVVAWIGFGMDDYTNPAAPNFQYLERLYPRPWENGGVAIFGPIFYADREAMQAVIERGLWPPPLQNRSELAASERGLAIAFHRAGYEVSYLEEYDNERIDQTRDYKFFDKFRPNRE